MKKKIARLFATALVAAIIISVAPAIRAAPPEAPALWIMPEDLFFDTAHNSVGDKFNVTVWVSTTGVSYTWQAKVIFDPAHVHAVRAGYTTASTSEFFAGHGVIPVVPTIDNTDGFVVHGESLVGLDSVADVAASTLFWIEFEIIAAPETDPLTSQIAVDPDPGNTFILDPDLNTVTVNVGSATYIFSPPPPVRDLAVTDVSLSNSAPKQGLDNVTITIVVLNNGTTTESFEVEVDFDTLMIGTLQVDSLAAEGSQTLTFEWNTTNALIGRHTIKATAQLLPGDTDPANNVMSKQITIISPTGPTTDLDGDGKVNMADIAIGAAAFGTKDGDSRWDAIADVNLDGVVDIWDIALVAKDFWKQ